MKSQYPFEIFLQALLISGVCFGQSPQKGGGLSAISLTVYANKIFAVVAFSSVNRHDGDFIASTCQRIPLQSLLHEVLLSANRRAFVFPMVCYCMGCD